MRRKDIVLALLLTLLALSTTSAQMEAKKSGGTSWAMKGDYFDACSCQYVCMCDFGVDPQMHNCEGVGAIKIKEGRYGETSLSGLSAAFYIKPGVEYAVYIDESASLAQRDGLNKIVQELLTGAGTDLGTKTAKINFEVKGGKASLEIPDVMKAKGEQVKGADGKKPIQVVNGHNPIASRVWAGKSSLNEFKDHSKEWKYEGRNAWLGVFDKRGTTTQ